MFKLEEAMGKDQSMASRMSDLCKDVIIHLFICWMILILCWWIIFGRDKKDNWLKNIYILNHVIWGHIFTFLPPPISWKTSSVVLWGKNDFWAGRPRFKLKCHLLFGWMTLRNQLTSLHLYFLIWKCEYIQILDEEWKYKVCDWEAVGFYKWQWKWSLCS